MAGSEVVDRLLRRPAPGLLMAVAAGAWLVQLAGMYLLVPWACRWGTTAPIHLLGAVVLAVGALTVLAARRSWRQATRTGANGGLTTAASATAGFSALLVCGLFVVAMVFLELGAWVIDPCL